VALRVYMEVHSGVFGPGLSPFGNLAMITLTVGCGRRLR